MDADSSSKANTVCPTCGASVPSSHLIPAGDSFVCPSCRDQYLQGLKETGSMKINQEDEAIRQEYIKHEASLKSVGLLYFLGAFFVLLAGLMGLVGALDAGSGQGAEGAGFLIGYTVAMLVISGLMFAVAFGFRKLKPWVKIPGTIVACLGLLNFPIGTLINAYILFLIWSRKGRFVLTPEYQEVIEATPHIKYKTSIVVWIFLGILIVLLLTAFLIPLLGSM